MASLDGFIDEVIDRLKTTTVAQFVPDDPEEMPSDWPFLPVYSSTFTCVTEFGGGNVKYLHDVAIGFLAPAQDIDLKNQVLLPEIENVVESVLQPITSGSLFTNCDTFGEISGIYGPIDWGGVPMFGFLLTISDVKIKRTIS